MGTNEAAARLIERVLSDSAFRAHFRQDPATAAREAGLESVEEPVADRALETLELRESKSSLAGGMTAAAVEGVGLYGFLDHLAGQLGHGDGAVSRAVSDLGVADAQAATPQGHNHVEVDPAAVGESDDEDEPDEDEPDEDEPDEDEPDEDEPDEDEPDEDEPDEDEPDEQGPDQDDLTDDEVSSEGDDDGASSDDDEGDDGDDGDDGDAVEPDLGDVASAYPGDQAPRAQVALWMAAEAQRRGLPAELPVMAALVESDMRNLPGGDADSAGFFQMRVGIWDSGAYAGYRDDPDRQLDWFLDHAEEVRQQRVASGLPVRDPAHYGDWIADVERPAAQYRGRYQLRLADAQELVRHQPARGPAEDVADAVDGGTPRAGARAQVALAEARRYLGTPYRWGGSTPQTGFDCSGLAQWAYAKAGIRIPRVTDQQILASGATKVDRDHLLPGDLVFFRDSTGYVHHVGISLGGARFIAAPHTGDVVKISSLDEPYYARQFTGGRRFDPAVRGGSGAGAHARAREIAEARAALARDAAEVSRPGTALFQAIEVQEAHKGNEARVLPAIRPDQVRRSR